MIFSTGLNKIYESISKQDGNKKETLLKKLNESIVKNPMLSYKFDLLQSIKGKKKTLNSEQAKKFVSKLKESHNKFLTENNSTAMFYRAEKELFEYFNVNQKEVLPSNLDLIVGKKNNELNEAVILEYVTDKRLVPFKKVMEDKKDFIKEGFKSLRKEGNISALERELSQIELQAKVVKGKSQIMIEAAVKSIKKEIYSDFHSAVDKTFKLKLITEKFLYEDEEDQLANYNDANKSNSSDDDYEDFEKVSKMKERTGPDFKHLKNVKIGLPTDFETESISISFVLPIYPPYASMGKLLAAKPEVRRQLLQLKNFFSKVCIYQAGNKILEPTDINWNAGVSMDINPQSGKYAEQVEAYGCYALPAKISMIVFIAIGTSTEKYYEAAVKALSVLDQQIQNSSVGNLVSPEIQKQVIIDTPKGRQTNYDKAGEQKYYANKAGKGSHDKDWTADWQDDAMTGEVEDSDVKNNSNDKEFYGDSQKQSSFDDDDNRFDDEEIDKMAQRKAMGR